MSTGHAGRLIWKPCAYAGRDADVSSLSRRADRHYSAESPGRAGRSRGRRFARHTRNHAGIARALAFIQRDAVDDYLSSCLLAAEPGAFRETESLGRYAASARAARKAYQRETTKFFYLTQCSASIPLVTFPDASADAYATFSASPVRMSHRYACAMQGEWLGTKSFCVLRCEEL